MKLVIQVAGLLVCSVGISIAQATLARGQPTQPSTSPPSEMSADWHAPAAAPGGASAPRGNLRGDIESNARWNENGPRPHGPRRR
jgi:hypothetical protein